MIVICVKLLVYYVKLLLLFVFMRMPAAPSRDAREFREMWRMRMWGLKLIMRSSGMWRMRMREFREMWRMLRCGVLIC